MSPVNRAGSVSEILPRLGTKYFRQNSFTEIDHLIKYDAFRVNRDLVMDLEIWLKIHTKVFSFETASPKPFKLLKCFMITMILFKMGKHLRIGSCLACVYRVMDARGKFEVHERRVRVARGAAESNSSFLSALQTSQVHP